MQDAVVAAIEGLNVKNSSHDKQTGLTEKLHYDEASDSMTIETSLSLPVICYPTADRRS